MNCPQSLTARIRVGERVCRLQSSVLHKVRQQDTPKLPQERPCHHPVEPDRLECHEESAAKCTPKRPRSNIPQFTTNHLPQLHKHNTNQPVVYQLQPPQILKMNHQHPTPKNAQHEPSQVKTIQETNTFGTHLPIIIPLIIVHSLLPCLQRSSQTTRQPGTTTSTLRCRRAAVPP